MTRFFLAALSLFLPAAFQAAQLSVLIDGQKPAYEKIIQVLERDFGANNTLQIFNLREFDLSNPITKGRFLAKVSRADIIIPIGDPATRLVSQELEDIKIFFISAAGLSGKYLNQPQVSGILSYSPEETTHVAKTLLPELKVIGVLYTPGYKNIVAKMQAAAQKREITLKAYRVSSKKEIGPIAREMMAQSDLFYVVGDPLLTQDLIFSYLLQEALHLKKPMATPIVSLVAKGALFSTVPDSEKLSQTASATLTQMLAAGPDSPVKDRIHSAPPEGFVVINRQLAEKWNISIPSSLRIWEGTSAP